MTEELWIALKFFVLLQSKQRGLLYLEVHFSCELLSNFLYFCSRNNKDDATNTDNAVVNCSQIFCTFAVETTHGVNVQQIEELWIALKFFVLLQSKQRNSHFQGLRCGCELLSNFLYFCSRNNKSAWDCFSCKVVNCSQIFCTFAVETTRCWLSRLMTRCELLSNFLYFCSRNNRWHRSRRER